MKKILELIKYNPLSNENGWIAAAIGAAASLATTLMSAQSSSSNQKRAIAADQAGSAYAFAKSKEAYRSRYQDTVRDLRLAGLNPILAAKDNAVMSGGFPQMTAPKGYVGPPTQYHNIASSAKDFAESMLVDKRGKQLETEAEKNISEELLNLEKVKESRARKNLLTRQEEETIAKVDKITNECRKIIKEVSEIDAKIRELNSRRGLNISKSNLNQAQMRFTKEHQDLLKKQIDKLMHELVILEKQADVYKGTKGRIISHIKEIMKAAGLNIGMFFGLKR